MCFQGVSLEEVLMVHDVSLWIFSFKTAIFNQIDRAYNLELTSDIRWYIMCLYDG